jgi:hypothetical protein
MAKVKENPLGILPLLILGGGAAAAAIYGALRAKKRREEIEAALPPKKPPVEVKPVIEPVVPLPVVEPVVRPELREGACVRIPNVELDIRVERPARYVELQRKLREVELRYSRLMSEAKVPVMQIKDDRERIKRLREIHTKYGRMSFGEKRALRDQYADAEKEYQRRLSAARTAAKEEQEGLFKVFRDIGWKIYPVPWDRFPVQFYYGCRPGVLPRAWASYLKSALKSPRCVRASSYPPPVVEELKRRGWTVVPAPRRPGITLAVVLPPYLCPPGQKPEDIKPVAPPLFSQLPWGDIISAIKTPIMVAKAEPKEPRQMAEKVAGLFSGIPQLHAAEAINEQFFA